ncbi:MAG: hypothetical protein ACYS7Y_11825 [Planctomycetota bacterium]|jgi:hypothetical protein
MPSKTCPKCSTKHGTRKKQCECGYSFNKSNHPLYPEPGGWVLDGDRKMPPIPQPEPLAPGPVDTKTVQHHVAYEGLGYSIWELIPAKRIKDKVLRARWVKARKAMQDVVEYLEEFELLEG